MKYLVRSPGMWLLVLLLTGYTADYARWTERSKRPEYHGREIIWQDLNCPRERVAQCRSR